MPGDPLISVVMPVRDGETHLRDAVESVLGQSFGDFECLILDDGSTDATPRILEEYREADPRVRLVTQEPLGLVATLNRGCSLARGRYIARMDADDVALPERFSQQVGFLEAHPEVGVLGGAMQFMTGCTPRPRFLRPPTGIAPVRTALQRSCCIAHPTVVMRRKVFDAAGGYRPQYLRAEDYDLWLRVAERHALDNLPEILVQHRLHEGQVSFAHLEQQALSALAARTAARSRRERGVDPTPGEGVISRRSLMEMGVAEATIDTAVIGDAVHRANLMLELGLEAQALWIAGALPRLTVSEGARSRLPAECSWLLAKVELRRRHRLRGAGWILRACLQRPSMMLSLMRALPRAAAAAGRRDTPA